MNAAQGILQNLKFDIGGMTFAPSVLQAAAIVGLLFVLVLSLARVRRLFIHWSFRSASAWLVIGFVLAMVLEGFLIIGGRTAITGLLGWKKAPKPLLQVLDTGRGKLVDVLGVTEEVPSSYAEQEPTAEKVIELYQSLDPESAASVSSAICGPQE